MKEDPSVEQPDYSSPKDLRIWLEREIKAAAKAFELRVQDATEFVTAYAAGELTPAEAEELQHRYYHRWGEALPGVFLSETMTDAKIRAEIDASMTDVFGEYKTPEATRGSYRARFGGPSNDAHTSR